MSQGGSQEGSAYTFWTDALTAPQNKLIKCEERYIVPNHRGHSNVGIKLGSVCPRYVCDDGLFRLRILWPGSCDSCGVCILVS